MLSHLDVSGGLGVREALEALLEVLAGERLRLPEQLEVPGGGEGSEDHLTVLGGLRGGGLHGRQVTQRVCRPGVFDLPENKCVAREAHIKQ